MIRDVTLPEALQQKFDRLYQTAMAAELLPTQKKITLERTRLNVFMENLSSLSSLSFARVEGVVLKFHGKQELPTDSIDREILGFYEASLEVGKSYENGFVLDDQRNKQRFNVLSRYHDLGKSFLTEDDKSNYRKKNAWVQSKTVIGQVQNMDYAKPENIKGAMDGLNNWANESLDSGVNPLVVAAIYHVEFEAIHPWVDENGRDGRLRIYEMLGKQLSLNGNLLLEEFILTGTDKGTYIRKMNEARGISVNEPTNTPGYVTLSYEKISERNGNAAAFLEYFANIYENALNKALALQPAVHREVS